MTAVWGVVLAAGRGRRFGTPPGTRRKHELLLAGRPLWTWAVAGARTVCDRIIVVVPPADVLRSPALQADVVVAGGATRADSVRAGLAAVPPDAAIVVVADAAHPLASATLYRAVVGAVRAGASAAVPGVPLAEVCKLLDGAGQVVATLPRQDVVMVQTPHAFEAAVLRRAHAGAPAAVEDSALVEALGEPVVVVPGDPANVHVVTPRDLAIAERLTGLVGPVT